MPTNGLSESTSCVIPTLNVLLPALLAPGVGEPLAATARAAGTVVEAQSTATAHARMKRWRPFTALPPSALGCVHGCWRAGWRTPTGGATRADAAVAARVRTRGRLRLDARRSVGPGELPARRARLVRRRDLSQPTSPGPSVRRDV